MLILCIIFFLVLFIGVKVENRELGLSDYYDTFYGDYVIRKARDDLPPCHDDKLITMLANIKIVNPENIVDLAVEHLPSVCEKLVDNVKTMEYYLRTCTPSHEDVLYARLIKGVGKLNEILCKNGELNPLYQKACDSFQKVDYKKCHGPPDWNENAENKLICQSYLKIIKCYKDTTIKKCGNDAGMVMYRTATRVISSVLPITCETINKDLSNDCHGFGTVENIENSETVDREEDESKDDDKKSEDDDSEDSCSDSEEKADVDAKNNKETNKNDVKEKGFRGTPGNSNGPKGRECSKPVNSEHNDAIELKTDHKHIKGASFKTDRFESRLHGSEREGSEENLADDNSGNKDSKDGKDRSTNDESGNITKHEQLAKGNAGNEKVKNQNSNVTDDKIPLDDAEDEDLRGTGNDKQISKEKSLASRKEQHRKENRRCMVVVAVLWYCFF